MKEDRNVIREYLKRKYPLNTHILNLDMTFDYIGGLCTRFLSNPEYLGFKIIDFDNDEIKKIEENIRNFENDETKYLYYFYKESQKVIDILKKYYYEDGKRK